MEKKTVKGYSNLDYVVLVDIPTRKSKFGMVLALDPAIIERRISEELILQRVPLRGREITFIRKTLGLSLEKFANSFGFSASGVLKWERNPDRRLDPLSEAGLRSWFAEKLGLELPGVFKTLVGRETAPETVEVRTKRAA